MEGLEFKPDAEAARHRWRAFWNREVVKRPCVAVTAPASPGNPPGRLRRQVPPDTDFDLLLGESEAALAGVHFGGEAMPIFQPSFGPDQLAAFSGARLQTSDRSGHTTWSEPFVEAWDEALPLRLGGGGGAWDRMLELCRRAGRRGRGRFLVGTLDLHSNFDWLAAIRGPDRLCMDLLDCPDLVRRAMAEARRLYPVVYERVYEAAGMAGRGTCGWLPCYCEERMGTTQCDYCVLLSPSQFREFVLPALDEECRFLDRSVYHFDGPGALPHFDAVTGLDTLDAIQWVPGPGESQADWVHLLKRFQAAGKSVVLMCRPDELKVLHRELRPEAACYITQAGSRDEAEALLSWLEANT